MGEVYRAHDPRLKRDIALKTLPEWGAQDRDRIARFEREAEILAALKLPSIAHIYGVEETEGSLAIVMDRASGCPASRERKDGGPDFPQMEPDGGLAQGGGALFDGGVGPNPTRSAKKSK